MLWMGMSMSIYWVWMRRWCKNLLLPSICCIQIDHCPRLYMTWFCNFRTLRDVQHTVRTVHMYVVISLPHPLAAPRQVHQTASYVTREPSVRERERSSSSSSSSGWAIALNAIDFCPQGHSSSLLHATLPAVLLPRLDSIRLNSTRLCMFALNTLKFLYSLSHTKCRN